MQTKHTAMASVPWLGPSAGESRVVCPYPAGCCRHPNRACYQDRLEGGVDHSSTTRIPTPAGANTAGVLDIEYLLDPGRRRPPAPQSPTGTLKDGTCRDEGVDLADEPTPLAGLA